jgi:steroid 5-alpha reductase family enzyme
MPVQALLLLPYFTIKKLMTFFQIYFHGLLIIIGLMSVLWIISIYIRNVSIVDLFWGFGFVLTNIFYFISTEGFWPRKIILLVMVSVWGFRLSGYLAWRNLGKGLPVQAISQQLRREEVLVDKLFSDLPSAGSIDVAHFSASSWSPIFRTR